MRTILLLISLILISSSAFADYCVSKKGDNVVVLYPIGRTCEEYAKEVGLEPTYVSSLPIEEKQEYWKLNGDKIEIDTVKKHADLDKAAQATAEKEAVLLKLKITKEELNALEL